MTSGGNASKLVCGTMVFSAVVLLIACKLSSRGLCSKQQAVITMVCWQIQHCLISGSECADCVRS